MGFTDVAIRILLAMVIGGVIGWERESAHRPAGLRTHILVALGAAMVMMTGQYTFNTYVGLTNVDPSRMAAQVISGIGFLGAGTIMREGANIKGLTTAASLWAVACLGIAVGAGFYLGGIIGTIGILLTLSKLDFMERKVSGGKGTSATIYIKCVDGTKTLTTINELALNYSIVISDITINQVGDEDYEVILKLHSTLSKKNTCYPILVSRISGINGIIKIKLEEY